MNILDNIDNQLGRKVKPHKAFWTLWGFLES